MPDAELLGTKVKGEYEWLTWKQTVEMAENLSIGLKKLDMASEVAAEGEKWRFFGI